MIRRTAVALLTLMFSVASLRSDDPKPIEDSKRLQGVWQAVELHAKGKKMARDTEEVKNFRFVFQGDELLMPVPGAPGGGRRKTFKLDPSKDLKEMDLLSLDGHEQGQTSACIYKIENDRLTLCMPYFKGNPGTRPKDFKAGAEDGQLLIVLERVESSE